MPIRNTHLNSTLLLFVIAGCAQPANRTACDVLVAIDTSGSARPDLAGYVAATSEVVQRLNPERDRLTVFRFDHKASELYDGPSPKLLESFELKLVSDLEDAASKRGTLPTNAVLAIAEHASRLNPQHPKVVIFFTDGGNDDLRAAALSDGIEAAKRLASDASIAKVIVAGVRPGLRESVRERLSPLQSKLVLAELDSVASEVR